MKTFTIVAVLGRPSANTHDFFNSIKFWTYEVRALTKEGALNQDPASQDDYSERTWSDYAVLNWYAFEKDQDALDTAAKETFFNGTR